MERALKSLRTADGRFAEPGASRPRWLAGRTPRPRWLVGGAVLLSRPRVRGRRKTQGEGTVDRDAITQVVGERVDGKAAGWGGRGKPGTPEPPRVRTVPGQRRRRRDRCADPSGAVLGRRNRRCFGPAKWTSTCWRAGSPRAEFPAGRRPQPYTHAQHALVVSEAVDTLARLRLTERRVLAVHAWLAQIRNSELKDRQSAGSGKKNLALRTMDIEALADVLARTNRWNDPQSRSDGVAPGAVAFDECLKSLGGLDAHERRRLSLYALLAETVFAGLGTAVAEAALEGGRTRPRSAGDLGSNPAVGPPDGGGGGAPRPARHGVGREESLAGHREKDRAD